MIYDPLGSLSGLLMFSDALRKGKAVDLTALRSDAILWKLKPYYS